MSSQEMPRVSGFLKKAEECKRAEKAPGKSGVPLPASVPSSLSENADCSGGVEITEVPEVPDIPDVPKEKYILFEVLPGITYALLSADCAEILKSCAVYPLPFVPPYVEGIVNRRGSPYTVINAGKLLCPSSACDEEQKNVLLVTAGEGQIALDIHKIADYAEIPADCFKPDESESLRRGTITVDESAVAVLDIQALESMLEKDLARQ
ncbi:chemotaxis protein CheW [Treponema sp.]|uniref:chemotaxis protein CheW n=1 Tax=Treponema sp. TaxID=166 RepID=UPI003EFEA6A2